MNRIIGVLWQKEKNGMPYYSGLIRDLHGDIAIAVFPNNRKETDNQPDMNIVLSFSDRKRTFEGAKVERPDEDLPF